MDYYDAQQVIIVLVGLIGSGKSTIATALELYFPQFVRCNQDDLGDRRLVEGKVHNALSAGKSVCIDRTNFDASQRWTWLQIGRQYPEVEVWCVTLDVSKTSCLNRLQTRTGHPTIQDFATARRVMGQMSPQFTTPCLCEGFDLLFNIPCDTPRTETEMVTPDSEGNTNPSVQEPTSIYTPAAIQSMLLNFVQAAQHPYRTKRIPLPPNPRDASPRNNSGGSSEWSTAGASSSRGPSSSRGRYNNRYTRSPQASSPSWR